MTHAPERLAEIDWVGFLTHMADAKANGQPRGEAQIEAYKKYLSKEYEGLAADIGEETLNNILLNSRSEN